LGGGAIEFESETRLELTKFSERHFHLADGEAKAN
jgi:hypothetical protein